MKKSERRALAEASDVPYSPSSFGSLLTIATTPTVMISGGPRVQFRDFTIAQLKVVVREIRPAPTGSDDARDSVSVRVTLVTTDRDYPDVRSHIDFDFEERWPSNIDEYPVHKAKLLRAMVLTALEHELDERIYVDGRRVFDPHEERAPYPNPDDPYGADER